MQRRVVVLAVGVVATAMLVLGTLDTLVWMPQQLAPGIAPERITAALEASGDLPYVTASALVWLVFWALVTAAYVVVLLPAVPRLRPAIDAVRPITVVAFGAVLLGAVGFLHWWSAFGMGMSVSDELPPYVGGTTVLGAALALGGLLLGAVGFVVGIVAILTSGRSRPVAVAS